MKTLNVKIVSKHGMIRPFGLVGFRYFAEAASLESTC